MRRALLFALAAGLAACGGRKAAQNYKNCLKLRVGMSGAEVLKLMGEPDETFPYEEGKSLPHMKDKTAFEWANPASMSAPNRVTLSLKSGVVESIRCGDVTVTASVFVEPPDPAGAAPEAVVLSSAAPPPDAAKAQSAPPAHARSGPQTRGKPLTGD